MRSYFLYTTVNHLVDQIERFERFLGKLFRKLR